MVMNTVKREVGIIRKDQRANMLMPLWCGIEPRTPPPGARGAALFLIFQRDEGGKGLEDTGKDEQRAGFRLGNSYLGWGSSAAEGVAGGRRKKRVITWGCEVYLS